MTVQEAATEFELTINGGLGPVLRHALGPELVVRTRACTTFVAESGADLDVLVDRLHCLGLRIESVFIVEPAVTTIDP